MKINFFVISMLRILIKLSLLAYYGNKLFDNGVFMTELDKKLGELVKEYRLRLNMTQLDLANRLDYDSVQFISLIERGMSKIPIKVIGKLVIILGIPEKKIIKYIINTFENDVQNQISEGKKSVS